MSIPSSLIAPFQGFSLYANHDGLRPSLIYPALPGLDNDSHKLRKSGMFVVFAMGNIQLRRSAMFVVMAIGNVQLRRSGMFGDLLRYFAKPQSR